MEKISQDSKLSNIYPSLSIDGEDHVCVNESSTASPVLSELRRNPSTISIYSKLSLNEFNITSLESVPMKEVHIGHENEVRKRSVAYLKKELEIDYHLVAPADLFKRYSSSRQQGLTAAQAKLNREQFGQNVLTPPKKEPLWLTFIKTLMGGFQLLLWAASLLSFAAYITQALRMHDPPKHNLYLGIVLGVLVIVLGLFTFYQEYSSGKVMESFAKMAPSYANVIREAKTQHVNASELVVGDIIEVKFGDTVPADIRILECQSFKVDNSSLTGESEPQTRSTQCTNENPSETKNLAFFSTNALEGTALGLVVAVGDNTFIGRIAGLTSGMGKVDTSMSREVTHFVKIISAVAIFFAVTFCIISLFIGYEILEAVIFLVGIIVAQVPEGLLVTFTVILALTAKRMARKNCLVRQLHAVETLGSCSVICTDKTGTLTQNKMTASHLWFGNKIVEASPDAHDFTHHDPGFTELSRVAALCSRAKFMPDQESLPVSDRKIDGDASECAILRLMELHLGNVAEYQLQCRKIFEIPFNSSNKWQLSIHKLPDDSTLLALKGAPERIINQCTKIRIGDFVHDLDSTWKNIFEKVYEDLGGRGERLIGFCDAILPKEKYGPDYKFDAENLECVNEELTFVGLISMIDPPRPGVPEAVLKCRTAGIKVVMVTGDHPITAKAIARKVGIFSKTSETMEEMAKRLNTSVEDIDCSSCFAVVVSGTELFELESEELSQILRNYNEIVFARVSPQQKLVIVEGFQNLNKIVAVTGDGVNDSPALKRADIGIAMGISGSDVSKQAADMILLDDNFSSIVTGVEEGRLIYENLKKCIRYLLVANTPSLLPFLAFIILKIPLPLGTVPMLVITLGTDILPTISLSYERPEGDIMKRRPRNPQTGKLVNGTLLSYAYLQLGVIEFCAGFLVYFIIMGQNGFFPQDLLGIRRKWDSMVVNDLQDSYGQEWTFYQRKYLEITCWSGYFFTIVICQWGNLLISKMRRLPLYTKLFDNWKIYFAIVVETLLACFFIYTPGLNIAMSFQPINFVWWLPAIPFLFIVMGYDEIRRYLLRKCPSWIWYQKEFYY